MAAVVEVVEVADVVVVEEEGEAALSCPLVGGRPVSALTVALIVVLAGGLIVNVTPLTVVVVLCDAELVVLGVTCGVEALFGL